MQAWRTAKGLTQEQAAELAGVSQPTWCDWENCKATPKLTHAVRIAAVTEGDMPVDAWLPEAAPAQTPDTAEVST